MKRRPPRRKPGQERSRALCASIEEAAAHVLVARGYEGSTTASIAARAGVSVGSVYQYYDDKDAVFDALTQRLLDELLRSVGPALAATEGTLDSRLELAAVGVHGVVARFPHVLRRLSAVPGTRFQRRLRDARRKATEATRALLELHRNDVAVDDLDLSARVLVDVAEGLLLNLEPHDDAGRIAVEARLLAVLYCTARRDRSGRGAPRRS